MRIYALTLALVVFTSEVCASNQQFDVDFEKVLALAVSAVSERFPEVSADDLALDGAIIFRCLPTRPGEGLHALDEEFRPCFALLDLVLTSRPSELTYVDRDGSCKIANEPKVFGVGLWPGSSLSTGLKRNATNDRVVDCAEAFGDSIPSPKHTLAENAFAVEVEKALQIAFKAAIDKYPDISADDLEFEGMIEMTCMPENSDEVSWVGGVKFAPCTTDVRFRSPTSIIEYRYVDVDGSCNLWRGPESIKVRIGGGELDPECARGSYSPTEQLVVECTAEFDDADRWTHDKSFKGQPPAAGTPEGAP